MKSTQCNPSRSCLRSYLRRIVCVIYLKTVPLSGERQDDWHYEVVIMWKEAVASYLSYCPLISLEERKKTKKTLNQNSWCSGRDSDIAYQVRAALPLEHLVRTATNFLTMILRMGRNSGVRESKQKVKEKSCSCKRPRRPIGLR
jgi:hypothetical protein